MEASGIRSNRSAHTSPRFFVVTSIALIVNLSIVGTKYLDPNSKFTNNRNEQSDETCRTEACKDLAAIYVENMDSSVDPCKNFFQYACGSARKIIGRPKTRRFYVHPYIDANDSTEKDIRNLITNREKFPSNTKNLIILRKFFDSCMDNSKLNEVNESINIKHQLPEETILKVKNEPLISLVRELGGLPVVGEDSNWFNNEDTYDWIDFLEKSRLLGLDFDHLFKIIIDGHQTNSSKPIIYLNQPHLSRDEVADLKRGCRNQKRVFQEALKLIGFSDIYSKSTDEQITSAVNLMSKLFKGYISRSDNLVGNYQIMTIKQFKMHAPHSDWNRILSAIVRHPISDQHEIGVFELDYFIELDRQLIDVVKIDMANFLFLRLISNLDDFFPSTYKIYHGEKRWREQCLDLVQYLMPLSVSTEYVRNFLDDDTRNQVTQMLETIKEQVIYSIKSDRNSLTPEARSAFSDKSEAILAYVSHTAALKNGKIIDKLYKGLEEELNEKEFFRNALRVRRKAMDHSFRLLNPNSAPDDWLPQSMTTTANAQYQSNRNSIYIRSAMLRNTFFNQSVPNYINFGALGSLIGHEFMHAFDTKSIKFDKFGNENTKWLGSNQTLDDHLNRLSSLIERYEHKQISGTWTYTNGTRTLNENAADIGGFQISYEAYQKYLAKLQIQEENEPLIDLIGKSSNNKTQVKLNRRQFYWLATASNFCDNMKSADIAELSSYDEHSPAEFRVNIGFSNIQAFSDSFNCPVGSPMNPSEGKWSIW